MNPCDLEIVLKSGQRQSIRVEYHRGHWKNPMTDAEVEEKFRALARRQLRRRARPTTCCASCGGSTACRRPAPSWR